MQRLQATDIVLVSLNGVHQIAIIEGFREEGRVALLHFFKIDVLRVDELRTLGVQKVPIAVDHKEVAAACEERASPRSARLSPKCVLTT